MSTQQPSEQDLDLSDLALRADLADYSPVRGCMVIKPYGYAIWEAIQRELDSKFKAIGCQNAYFPLLIPESFLKKEAEHVEGFAPECAVVTHAGGEKLEEPFVIRPTSETIIYSMFSKWIRSWRDLPLCINQWANVMRWEKRTRLFLRTTEFLWQEGHTAHADADCADRMARQMLQVYADFMRDFLALAPLTGEKTQSERFAGAERTYSLELLLRDGKVLQAGTSHYLGANFARAFDIQYQDKNNNLQHVHLTSWGVSTRLIGGLVLGHSDERGLILPPRVAPTQVMIIPIYKTTEEQTAVLEQCQQIRQTLVTEHQLRVGIDDDDQSTPGNKFNKWELKGVPLRIHIGPNDLKNQTAELARRDTREKIKNIPIAALATTVVDMLNTIQVALYERSLQFRKDNTRTASSIDEINEILDTHGGFVRIGWCGDPAHEAQIKEQTKATIRVRCTEATEPATCIVSGAPADGVYYAGRAY